MPLDGAQLEEHGLLEAGEKVGVEVQARKLTHEDGRHLPEDGVNDGGRAPHGSCVLGRHGCCVRD